MLHFLRRHPMPIRTMFGDSIALTYAFAPEALTPLLSRP
jgi:hypothetical protein